LGTVNKIKTSSALERGTNEQFDYGNMLASDLFKNALIEGNLLHCSLYRNGGWINFGNGNTFSLVLVLQGIELWVFRSDPRE